MIKTITYHGGECLAYTETGDPRGFPVLVQHGLIASIQDQALFHGLADSGARVISIARPGYGDSSPYALPTVGAWGEIVAGLVDSLGLAHFDVLGISSGAPYSYAIGYHLAERVRQLFILSGTPALFDAEVRAHWPYPLTPEASLAEMQDVAYQLFFAHRSPEDLQQPDIKDAMANHCFGVGLDLRIRCRDWGFALGQVTCPVYMRHSRADDSVPLITAERTAQLLPNGHLEIRANDPHFSPAVLDDFIQTVMLAPAH